MQQHLQLGGVLLGRF